VSTGTGTNYGIDAIFEKFFRGGSFFMISGSLFNSTYVPYNGKRYNTQYSSKFMCSFTGGREWEFKNGSAQQLGLKILNNMVCLTPL
jgi:hypothetical protein